MKRLHFLVEGPTEKEFVDNVLAGHLLQYDKICDARLVMSSRDWSGGVFYKGGIASYGKLRHEIESQIRVDHNPDSYYTTMIDYYGLPKGFPGRSHGVASGANPRQAVQAIESLFRSDVAGLFPSLVSSWNVAAHFIPNIMCHEFEALLFSDLDKMLFAFPARSAEVAALKLQLTQFGDDPELVNTSPMLAPSKRILEQIAEYDKVIAGTIVTLAIGLPELRRRCAHFDSWVRQLEAL